jgi:hypothetical protein
MTVLERVRDFIISQAPAATCDDCIARALKLSVRQHANHKTRELAKSPGFDRGKDRCWMCGATKEVIWLHSR